MADGDVVTKPEFKNLEERHGELQRYVHGEMHPRLHQVEDKADATEWEVNQLLKPKVMTHDKILVLGNGQPSLPEQVRTMDIAMKKGFDDLANKINAWGFWLRAAGLIVMGEILVATLGLIAWVIRQYITSGGA